MAAMPMCTPKSSNLSVIAGMVLVLVLGVDRFVSEARGIANLLGNTVATIFVAWWEGSLDIQRPRRILNREGAPVAIGG